MTRVALLFSGGTDSTAAAALLAETHDAIDLLTFRHSGLKHLGNIRRNVPALDACYPQVAFHHRFADVDRLFKAVTYADYASSLRRHGLFSLTTCGLCKLAMHLRALVYCLENSVTTVADGANVNSSHFPAQMPEVIAKLKALYAEFGIAYVNPVFDLDHPHDLDWLDKVGLQKLAQAQTTNGDTSRYEAPMTTGRVLYERGILPAENVKGTELDRNMQARCFQLTLLNAFARGWYIPRKGMEAYRRGVSAFYDDKLVWVRKQVRTYLENRNTGQLANMISAMKEQPDV